MSQSAYIHRLKEERNKNYSDEEMLSLLYGLGQLYDMQTMPAENIVDPLKLHQALGDYRVHNLLRSVSVFIFTEN